MVTEPTSIGWCETPNGGCNPLAKSEGRVAAHGGEVWRADAAITYPSCQDGWEAVFGSALAPAQFELWLPSGVARNASACSELWEQRARDRVCMPHAACESPLRALVTHGRRPC